jgi:Fe-S-cluster-containing dehydrogenase component
MPVIINWKVCDNSKECSAMAVCPTKTITWDEKNKTLKIDNSKCIGCGQCELACPAGAVIVARTDEEIKKIRERIEKDTRKASDLFVDRYGADAVDPSTLVDKSEFGAHILKSDKTAVVEFFSDESIKCMVY